MPYDPWIDNRTPCIQATLGAVGMVAFCIFSRSWQDVSHLIYDIPASFAVFSFVAQLLLEAIRAREQMGVARSDVPASPADVASRSPAVRGSPDPAPGPTEGLPLRPRAARPPVGRFGGS